MPSSSLEIVLFSSLNPLLFQEKCRHYVVPKAKCIVLKYFYLHFSLLDVDRMSKKNHL